MIYYIFVKMASLITTINEHTSTVKDNLTTGPIRDKLVAGITNAFLTDMHHKAKESSHVIAYTTENPKYDNIVLTDNKYNQNIPLETRCELLHDFSKKVQQVFDDCNPLNPWNVKIEKKFNPTLGDCTIIRRATLKKNVILQ